MSKEISFDRFTIEIYADGYLLRVAKMRPRNAPRLRRTDADRKRSMREAAENLRLAEEGLEKPMQTLDEVVARIRSYGGIV